jgi:predicted nucleic acid-binding protein
MRYVDTSIIIAYLTPEAHSHAAQAFMRSAGDPLTISSWSEVELMSALGVKLRTRQFSDVRANDVIDSYSRLVSPHLDRLDVEDADHRNAAMLLHGWQTALRAGDALHLAIAAARGATVYTFDHGLIAAGIVLGIPVILV